MHDIIALLSTDIMAKPLWMWLSFFGVVLFLLVLDLGVFNRKDHEIEVKESLWMSAFYISIGLLFGGWVWYSLGEDKGIEYLTGFVVEKTLAMDNIFVIAMIFSYFHIPRKYQHRVLFWGILGVILLRGIMIGLGAALVHEFEWVLYIFAAFLVFTGVKMLIGADDEPDIGENAVLKFMQRNFRTTKKMHGHNFFAREEDKKTGKLTWVMTPLFVTLVMIEIADVIFAVDSVPAIFAITTDTYIVYTSNIFAILGLRALYFALAAMINRFTYLKYALSIVLIFIGTKIFVADMLGLMKFPPLLSLGVTIAILVSGVIFSLWKTKKEGAA
ncbi:MAG: TerC family protein [Alphaproteobacteria bacterium]|nr:TerC family protein [Alphaproteobacteria bacterium]MCD8519847.1 TerC family protein [Alphaproteobacteria bacterium]MCD8571039.1 TerC family protein [Alphaproteobacteria bacterium]